MVEGEDSSQGGSVKLTKTIKTPHWCDAVQVAGAEQENDSRIKMIACNGPASEQLFRLLKALFVPSITGTLSQEELSKTSCALLFELDTLVMIYLLRRLWYPSTSAFVSQFQYAAFVKDEMSSLSSHCRSLSNFVSKLRESPDSYTVIRLNVIGARGLQGKEKNGKSNPYLTVSLSESGLKLTSTCLTDDLNPIFNFGFPFLLSDDFSEMNITVWSESGMDSAKDKNPFLGRVILSIELLTTLLSSSSVGKEVWLPLAKRSSRSNVSGELGVILSSLDSTTLARDTGFRGILNTIPAHPRKDYKSVLLAILKFELSHSSHEISAQDVALLDEMQRTWRISPLTHVACYLSACVELLQNANPNVIDFVLPILPDVVSATKLGFDFNQDHIECLQSLSTLYQISIDQLSFQNLTAEHAHTFYSHVYMLKLLCEVAPPFLPDRTTDLDAYLKGLFNKQVTGTYSTLFRGLDSSLGGKKSPPLPRRRTFSASLTSSPPLTVTVPDFDLKVATATVLTCIDQLQLFREHFDEIINGFIYLPQLVGKFFFDHLYPAINITYSVYQSDFASWMDYYHAVKDLTRLYAEIDPKLAKKFEIDRWFQPLMKMWLRTVQGKFAEWATNALQVDEFTPMSNVRLNSSSVFDIMTSYSQQVKSLHDLEWPNADQAESFQFQLQEAFLSVLDTYCQLLNRKISDDLLFYKQKAVFSSPTSANLSPTQSLSDGSPPKKPGKFLARINLKRKQVKRVDVSHVRFSAKACVMMNNIEAVGQLAAQMMIPSPVGSSPRSLRDDEDSPANPLHVPHKYPTELDFIPMTFYITASLPLSLPLTTKILCRVFTSPGSILLGSTERLDQHETLGFNTPIFASISKGTPMVEILIYHHVDDKEYIFQRIPQINIGEPPLEDYPRHTMQLQIGNSAGTLLLERRHEIDTVADWMNRRIVALVNRSKEIAIESFVNALCFDFRKQLKVISEGYKPVALKALTSSIFAKLRIDPSKSGMKSEIVDEAEIRTRVELDLDPLLAFINSNFGLLMESMEPALAHRIVMGIWGEVVEVLESLVVLPLHSEGVVKVPYEEKRLLFVKLTLTHLFCFLHSDGEGVSADELDNPPYKELCAILRLYFVPKVELQAKLQELASKGDTISPEYYAVLKLLKLAGDNALVTHELRAQFTRSHLDVCTV